MLVYQRVSHFNHLNIKHLWGSTCSKTCSNDWVTTTPVIAEFPSSSRSSVSLKVGMWWNGIWLLEHTRCWQTSNEATNGGFVEFVDFGKHAILAHCKGPACWARTFLNFHRSRATSAMGYMTLMSSAPRIIVIVVCRYMSSFYRTRSLKVSELPAISPRTAKIQPRSCHASGEKWPNESGYNSRAPSTNPWRVQTHGVASAHSWGSPGNCLNCLRHQRHPKATTMTWPELTGPRNTGFV